MMTFDIISYLNCAERNANDCLVAWSDCKTAASNSQPFIQSG